MTNYKAQTFLTSLYITKASFSDNYNDTGDTVFGEAYFSSSKSYTVKALIGDEDWIIENFHFIDSYDFFSSFRLKDDQNSSLDVYDYFNFRHTDGYILFANCFDELFHEIDKEYSDMRTWEIAQNKKVLRRYHQTKKR